MNGDKSGNLKPFRLELNLGPVPSCLVLTCRPGGGTKFVFKVVWCLFEKPAFPPANRWPHCPVQTSSLNIASLDHSLINWEQSVTLKDAHWPWTLLNVIIIFYYNCKGPYLFNYNFAHKLTPSVVQIQLVHGEGKAESPTATCRSPITHPWPVDSLQAFKSIAGREWQDTRGFKKLDGKSNASLCIFELMSILSHIILASDIFRISANCASVNLTTEFSFSYLIKSCY